MWQRDSVRLALTLAWVVLLVTGQLAVGGRLAVVPWLALGPLVASLVLTWRPTAAVAVAAAGAVAFLSAHVGQDLSSGQGVVRVLGSAALGGFAVLSARVRVRREERIRTVTEIATVAQTAILNPVPARVGGFAFASRYVSASADALVGGDLFDVVATDRGVRVVVGDVRGKGLPAVHTAAAVLSAFRHRAPLSGTPLDEVARGVEAAVADRLGPEDFVTAVLCELHADGRLDLVLCGHPAPLLIDPDGPPRLLGEHRSPPLGLGVDVRVETATLRPGQRLLFYTDGLVEARDARGEFFDLFAAAGSAAAGSAATGSSRSRGTFSAEALDADLETLLERVRAHVGGVIGDDLAMLLVQQARPTP